MGDLSRLGVAMGGKLGVDQFAVQRHFKAPPVRRHNPKGLKLKLELGQ